MNTPTAEEHAAAQAVEHDVFAETMTGYGGCWSDHRRSFNNGYAQALADQREVRELLQQMLDVAENCDETGYADGVGFVDLDKLHDKVRAVLANIPSQRTSKT